MFHAAAASVHLGTDLHLLTFSCGAFSLTLLPLLPFLVLPQTWDIVLRTQLFFVVIWEEDSWKKPFSSERYPAGQRAPGAPGAAFLAWEDCCCCRCSPFRDFPGAVPLHGVHFPSVLPGLCPSTLRIAADLSLHGKPSFPDLLDKKPRSSHHH